MFWINFYWLVTADPTNVDLNDVYRMNDITWLFWRNLTTDQIALAIILDILTEEF